MKATGKLIETVRKTALECFPDADVHVGWCYDRISRTHILFIHLDFGDENDVHVEDYLTDGDLANIRDSCDKVKYVLDGYAALMDEIFKLTGRPRQ